MQLYQGRPTDGTPRTALECQCYDLLDSLQIDYQRVDHPPAMTMELCAGIEQVLQAPICKNLLLCNRQGTDFYLLLMPGDKNFRTSVLSREIGSARLSFASPEHMLQLLGVTPGSVSVLGLMNDREKQVQLLLDRDILLSDFFGCHPCINTSTLRLRLPDVTEKLLPALGHPPRLVTLPQAAPPG